jgi:hypothetical protein
MFLILDGQVRERTMCPGSLPRAFSRNACFVPPRNGIDQLHGAECFMKFAADRVQSRVVDP